MYHSHSKWAFCTVNARQEFNGNINCLIYRLEDSREIKYLKHLKDSIRYFVVLDTWIHTIHVGPISMQAKRLSINWWNERQKKNERRKSFGIRHSTFYSMISVVLHTIHCGMSNPMSSKRYTIQTHHIIIPPFQPRYRG